MTSALHKVSSSGDKSSSTSYPSTYSCQNQVISSELDINNSNLYNNHSASIKASRKNKFRNEKNKGSGRLNLVDGAVDDILDEDFVTDTEMIRHSRRGQTSITHLMSFNLPPLPQDYRNTSIREIRRRNGYKTVKSHYLCDKASYIHANYRFIVKPNGNYRLQVTDVDQPLDWSNILQILVSSVSQDASCPICLSHPLAPRMAKCGHILCLPCLIRYVNSDYQSDPILQKKSRWRKCPICWDPMHISDMKPVRWYAGQENLPPREGEEIVLRLVLRKPGNILALPRDVTQVQCNSEDIPWYLPEVADYARIMKGSEEYMLNQYNIEIDEIKRLENEDKIMFGENPDWTRKALNEVNDAKIKIEGIGGPTRISKENELQEPLNKLPENDETIASFQFIGQDLNPQEGHRESKVVELKNPVKEHYNRKLTSNKNEELHLEKSFLFYQALPHYYLAPLDIRILKLAYGSFNSFPSTIISRVDYVSTGHIIDQNLRKRIKYLSHLPQGCEISFLECNWSDIIPPEILGQFAQEIEKRRKRNNEKEIREERDRVLAQRAEDDAHWAEARRQYTIDSESFAQEAFHRSTTPSNVSSSWPIPSKVQLDSHPGNSNSVRTVWGTAPAVPSAPQVSVQQMPHDENDGWLHAWEAEQQAEDLLVTDTQKLSLDAKASDLNPTGRIGQSKKKKSKKITLMSTTTRRAA